MLYSGTPYLLLYMQATCIKRYLTTDINHCCQIHAQDIAMRPTTHNHLYAFLQIHALMDALVYGAVANCNCS